MDNLKTSAYKNLVNVNFQQYDITSFLNKVPQGKRTKASNATPMKAFARYFRNIGILGWALCGIFNLAIYFFAPTDQQTRRDTLCKYYNDDTIT